MSEITRERPDATRIDRGAPDQALQSRCSGLIVRDVAELRVASDGAFEFTGSDPWALLLPTDAQSMEPLARFSVRARFDAPSPTGKLYLDYGNGFSESAVIGLSSISESHYAALIAAPSRLKALRWDPNEAPGFAHIEAVGLEAATFAADGALSDDPDTWARLSEAIGRAAQSTLAGSSLRPSSGEASVHTLGNFESGSAHRAKGWAYAPSKPDTPVLVEFIVDDVVIHTDAADDYRIDLAALDYRGGWAAFETRLPLDWSTAEAHVVRARARGARADLPGSPMRILRGGGGGWATRSQLGSPRRRAELRAALDARVGSKTLSFVLPMIGDEADLADSVRSVLDQWCSCWELLCVGSPGSKPVFANNDPRVREVPAQGVWLDLVKAGVEAARGDATVLLSGGDGLEADASYRLLRARMDGGEQHVWYADETLAGVSLAALGRPIRRPAFSPELAVGQPYPYRPVCLPTALARTVLSAMGEGSPDPEFELWLRAIAQARVRHLPRRLYRRRVGGGRPPDEISAETLETRRRIVEAVPWAAASAGAVVTAGDGQALRFDYPDPGGRVIAIVPTKDRLDLIKPCLESLLRTTSPDDLEIVVIDHDSSDPEVIGFLEALPPSCTVLRWSGPFNYSRMNNDAVRFILRRDGRPAPYILFANNDIEAIASGWLERLRSLASRPGVGAVGATLLYPDERVQHAGVQIGLNGVADHLYKFEPVFGYNHRRRPGPDGELLITREYSAVTAAFMLVRSEAFLEIDGYDEAMVVAYSDADLCLRMGRRGWRILHDAHTLLYHHEAATRATTAERTYPEDTRRFGARWRKLIAEGDPFARGARREPA